MAETEKPITITPAADRSSKVANAQYSDPGHVSLGVGKGKNLPKLHEGDPAPSDVFIDREGNIGTEPVTSGWHVVVKGEPVNSAQVEQYSGK
jgi:hypothetical protein